jgi:hypothetical protein
MNLLRPRTELAKLSRLPWMRDLSRTWHAPARLAAAFVLLLLANVVSFRHAHRLDLTENQRFTLSNVTKSLAKSLKQEIDVIAVFLPSSEIADDVRTLIDEYRKASGKKIRVEWIDPARQPDRVEAIKAQHKVSLRGSSILVARGSQRRVLREEDLLQRDGSGLINKFNGEIALSAALIEVLEETPRKLILVTGHSPAPELQAAAEELRVPGSRQNVKLEYATLNTGGIPADASVVVIAAPQTDFSPIEMREIERYWSDGRGSLFISLNPDSSTPRLRAFIRALGVAPRGDRVLYLESRRGQSAAKIFSVTAAIRPGSAITRDFEGMDIHLGGRSESLELFPDADLIRAQNIHLTPLLVADPRYWGETNFNSEPVRRDRSDDHSAPLYVAAAVEKGAVDDPNLRVDTQRLIVVSNPGILIGGIDRDQTQADFVMSCLNWLMDRTHLAGITPKEPARYAVELSDKQRARLERFILWIGPGLAVIAGIGMGWWRRK